MMYIDNRDGNKIKFVAYYAALFGRKRNPKDVFLIPGDEPKLIPGKPLRLVEIPLEAFTVRVQEESLRSSDGANISVELTLKIQVDEEKIKVKKTNEKTKEEYYEWYPERLRFCLDKFDHEKPEKKVDKELTTPEEKIGEILGFEILGLLKGFDYRELKTIETKKQSAGPSIVLIDKVIQKANEILEQYTLKAIDLDLVIDDKIDKIDKIDQQNPAFFPIRDWISDQSGVLEALKKKEKEAKNRLALIDEEWQNKLKEKKFEMEIADEALNKRIREFERKKQLIEDENAFLLKQLKDDLDEKKKKHEINHKESLQAYELKNKEIATNNMLQTKLEEFRLELENKKNELKHLEGLQDYELKVNLLKNTNEFKTEIEKYKQEEKQKTIKLSIEKEELLKRKGVYQNIAQLKNAIKKEEHDERVQKMKLDRMFEEIELKENQNLWNIRKKLSENIKDVPYTLNEINQLRDKHFELAKQELQNKIEESNLRKQSASKILEIEEKLFEKEIQLLEIKENRKYDLYLQLAEKELLLIYHQLKKEEKLEFLSRFESIIKNSASLMDNQANTVFKFDLGNDADSPITHLLSRLYDSILNTEADGNILAYVNEKFKRTFPSNMKESKEKKTKPANPEDGKKPSTNKDEGQNLEGSEPNTEIKEDYDF